MTKKRTAASDRMTMAAALNARPGKAAELPDHGAIDNAVAAAEPVQLLTPQQAAEILALSKRALEHWRMTGEGPRFLKLSRATIRYTAADLAAFQDACVRRNTTQG